MLVRRCSVLCGCGSLRCHLQLANLSLRQATVACILVRLRMRLRLVRLRLLELRWWCLWLIQSRRLAVRSVEVNAGRRWGDFTLCLEQARLEIDDVVA